MAAINFVKGEQYYTAEFQINGPVNVHIERAEAGALYFRQRSIDHGSYDLINGANWNNRGDLTIDTAIQGVVYPMWIKIESASEPTLAEMVEGEQSGGGAGNESTWRYFDISKCSIEEIELMAHIVKTYRDGGYIGIVSSGALSMAGSSTERIAMGIDMAVGFCSIVGSTEIINYGEHLAPIISDILANGAVEITKEQFYNLEA